MKHTVIIETSLLFTIHTTSSTNSVFAFYRMRILKVEKSDDDSRKHCVPRKAGVLKAKSANIMESYHYERPPFFCWVSLQGGVSRVSLVFFCLVVNKHPYYISSKSYNSPKLTMRENSIQKRDGCWETRQKKPITLFWVTKLTFSGKRAYQHQTIQPERHDFLGKYLRICVVMIFMCTL